MSASHHFYEIEWTLLAGFRTQNPLAEKSVEFTKQIISKNEWFTTALDDKPPTYATVVSPLVNWPCLGIFTMASSAIK